MELIKKYAIAVMVCLEVFFFTLTGQAAVFSAFKGQINADNINLRTDSTTSASVICVLTKGAVVEVVGEAYNWYKVRLPKNAPAYIKKNLVECNNTDPQKKCPSAKIIAERVNIRLGPSEATWVLGKADKSTVVNIISDHGEWYRIEPVYDSYGWVNKKFVEKDLRVEKPAETALKKEQPLVAAVEVPTASSSRIVLTGKIFPYGVVLWRKATHKLITVDNQVYFLKGNRKALNSLNYHQVKVSGELITPPGSKHPIIEISVIEALD